MTFAASARPIFLMMRLVVVGMMLLSVSHCLALDVV
jgi:hypothetical protein